MSLAPDAERTAALRGRVEQLAMGQGLAAILFASVELGLFEHLADGPLDATALAARAAAPPRSIERVAEALCVLGLLSRTDDGRFAATPEAIELLSSRGADSLVPVLRYHQRLVAPLMLRLADAARRGRPQLSAWSFASPGADARHGYDELPRHPDEFVVFLEAMDRFAIGAGTDLAAALDWRGVRRLIDVGGGSGRIARELLAAVPHLTVEMLDLPLACRMAADGATRVGLSDRFRATEADLTLSLPGSVEPGDAVLLAGILADWSPEDQLGILRRAATVLRPGGCLLIHETLLDEDRRGPATPVLLSVLMLAAMQGDNLTLSELRARLGEAGFSHVEHHPPPTPGRRDLVIARR